MQGMTVLYMVCMQAVPIYISEMSPYRFRGALNIGFQLATTIGIVVASLINYCKPFQSQQQCSSAPGHSKQELF